MTHLLSKANVRHEISMAVHVSLQQDNSMRCIAWIRREFLRGGASSVDGSMALKVAGQ